jgi:uncharacterized membrane protein YphA (DoxX/SURF4 family)
MKRIIFALGLALLPLVSSAHTKWFADDNMPAVPNEPGEVYIAVWFGIIFVIVTVGLILHKTRWFNFDFLRPHQPHVFERAASTFAMVTGSFLIIAGTHAYLFSPNLTPSYGIPMYLIFIQIAIGLAFLLGIASRVSGIILAGLWATLFYYTSWVDALENIWVLSTAIFITLMGNEYFSIVSFSALRSVVAPFKKYALSVLRVGTGSTLMVLGLSEKILAPEYGLNFLESHHWNFMQALGFPYTDYLFTISAGSVEFLFGLIFVLGIVTRLNAFVVAIVFTIPLFILGPIELTGHLPHFLAVVLLLLFGGGGHFTFFSDKKYR